jgi:hypothetical protein
MTAEKVHGIFGYYDGILDGVANFMGAPHAFAIDGDHEAESPRYRLKALSPDEFELFEELWQMWRRREDAFERGEIRATSPAILPADRLRHDEIEPMVKKALDVPERSSLVARGAFRPTAHPNSEPDRRWGSLEVVWTPL